MRPVANFTLHAILAAAIVALATTSAAAQAQLTIGNEGIGGSPQGAKGDKPRIAVLEFKWGTTTDSTALGGWAKAEGLDVTWDVAEHRGVSKIDSLTIKQKPAQQGFAPGNTKYSNVKLTRANSGTETSGGSPVGGNETITTHGNRTESGLPTGKRQHKPFVLAQPLGKGSVWIRVASAWTACRVGERFPTMELSDGGKAYRLEGVTVANCGRSRAQADRPTEEVAFTYSRISF